MAIFFALINISALFICLPISIKCWIEDKARVAFVTSALCAIYFSLLFLHYLPLHWGLIEAN